jgi:alkylation response protein AidB-like acyl-CoA dehydrogenase
VCATRWITNGTFADYFTVGCKTKGGYTVMLVPRCAGLSTRLIKTAYSATAGTAFVTFDKVRVPVSNTLGKEGKGMSVILNNFNHERWAILVMSLSTQRLIVEECLKYFTLSHRKPSFLIDGVLMQVVAAAASVRQTAELAGRRACETRPNDRARRVGTELAGECHTPDEQRLSFSFLPCTFPIRGLNFGTLVDVLCGTI